MHAPPTLTTDRLILRPPRLDDFDASLRLWSEPEVTRHIGGRPHTETEVWDRLLKKAGNWTLLGYGYWMVERRDAPGEPIGQAGFALNRRLFDPPSTHGWPDDPEAGWAFNAAAHGQGFAGEAVRAALAWGDAQGFARTVCLIDEHNAASLALAARCGYVAYDAGGLNGRSSILLERLRPG